MNEIRQLTIADLPDAARLGLLFYAEGKLPGRLVPEVFVHNWTRFLASGCGFGYGLHGDGRMLGAIAGMLSPCPNDGELQAQEMFWFVHPEARIGTGGLKLLDAWERGAHDLGAVRLAMIHLHALAPERLAKLYEHRGYARLETSYFKVIRNQEPTTAQG